eukprot:11193640-Lingulodinium_polyedra.AAC.1
MRKELARARKRVQTRQCINQNVRDTWDMRKHRNPAPTKRTLQRYFPEDGIKITGPRGMVVACVNGGEIVGPEFHGGVSGDTGIPDACCNYHNKRFPNGVKTEVAEA